jgi:hypothetical protein
MTIAKNAAAPMSARPPQRGRHQASPVALASTTAALSTATLSPVNSSGPKALPISISQKKAVARVGKVNASNRTTRFHPIATKGRRCRRHAQPEAYGSRGRSAPPVICCNPQWFFSAYRENQVLLRAVG